MPFVLTTICYHTSFASYRLDLESYLTSVGTGPVQLIRNGVDQGDFIVMDITEAQPPQAVYSVAGAPDKQCRSVLRWTLIHQADP